MNFPIKSEKEEWTLDDSKIEEWKEAYPKVNIATELLKSRQWLRDNVDNRKTRRGMLRFLGSWLCRVQNRNEQITEVKSDGNNGHPKRTIFDIGVHQTVYSEGEPNKVA